MSAVALLTTSDGCIVHSRPGQGTPIPFTILVGSLQAIPSREQATQIPPWGSDSGAVSPWMTPVNTIT